jgi:hypothetical protein
MKTVYIYGLYTNQDDTIRYVGKCSDPDYRLKMHYSQRNYKKSYKNEWIKKSIKNGEKILIKIIEEVNENDWPEKEKEWINKFDNLTNLAEGGKGGSVKKYNIEYDKMKDIIKKNNLKSKMDFIKFTKSVEYPNDLPKDPPNYFKNKWISWGDFLGTNRKQDNKIIENYTTYEEAKNYINNNFNIKSIKEWKKNLDKIPNFIPKRPERFYKNRGWISWVDFLSKKRIANQNRKIVSYKDAKKIVKDLNIKTLKEYKRIQSELYINELPVHPHLTYKNKGFINYDEFFQRL